MYYDKFNEQLISFLKQLTICYPQISEFKKITSGLSLLKTMDKKMPAKLFKEHASKFEMQIKKKDEEFFINNNEYEILDSVDKNEFLDFINQLKIVWKDTSEENKDVIWKYLNVLLIISKKI